MTNDTANYLVVIERDEDGYWFVDFPDVPGCHTQGRTLRQARTRAREVLDLFVDDADNVTLVEELRLPNEVRQAVTASAARREQAAREQTEAQDATAEAARRLLDAGLTLRDAGEVLGLSFQRIAQITNQRTPVKAGR
jgi:predicted RNase H-like HicB family nuclease